MCKKVEDRYDLMMIILLTMGAKYNRIFNNFVINNKKVVDFKFLSNCYCFPDEIAKQIDEFDIRKDLRNCRIRKMMPLEKDNKIYPVYSFTLKKEKENKFLHVTLYFTLILK